MLKACNYLFITSVCLLIVSHVVSAFYWGICLKNGKQVVIECLCLADKIVMSWNLVLGSSMSRRPVCCENKSAQVPPFCPHFPSHPAFLPPRWGQHCLGGRWDASPWGLARPWSRELGPGLDGQWCQDYGYVGPYSSVQYIQYYSFSFQRLFARHLANWSSKVSYSCASSGWSGRTTSTALESPSRSL